MLEDAVLDLLQAVVVIIEFLLYLFEIKVVFGIGVPRQVEHIVEVGVLYRVVGRLGVEAFQFAQLFFELFLYVLVPFHLVASLLQLLNVVDIGTQFFLDGTYLLLQEVVALLLGQFLAGA